MVLDQLYVLAAHATQKLLFATGLVMSLESQGGSTAGAAQVTHHMYGYTKANSAVTAFVLQA